MNILFFDTETTGLFDFKADHSGSWQPHLVQLGAVLHDVHKHVKASLNILIKPDRWEIPDKAVLVHGITTNDAFRYGVPLSEALGMFTALVDQANLVVAHNMQYDAAIMATQYYRGKQHNRLPFTRKFCTMEASTDILKLPGKYGNKWPSLQEAHKHFTGEEFDGAHDAMADVLACSRVFYALEELNKNKEAEEFYKTYLS